MERTSVATAQEKSPVGIVRSQNLVHVANQPGDRHTVDRPPAHALRGSVYDLKVDRTLVPLFHPHLYVLHAAAFPITMLRHHSTGRLDLLPSN